jgi:hypothetical protein
MAGGSAAFTADADMTALAGAPGDWANAGRLKMQAIVKVLAETNALHRPAVRERGLYEVIAFIGNIPVK